MVDVLGTIATAGALANTFGGLLDTGFALITTSTRLIGTIVPDVTIEEIHRDEMLITDHPVEIGAPITDHAFMRPQEVEMRCGFSNSSARSEGYVQQVYQAFLALQKSRQPINVFTGKRMYTSMLIRSIAVITDVESENALMITVGLRQIIITSTSSSPSGAANSDGGGTGSASDMANPQQNAPTVDTGSANLNGPLSNFPTIPGSFSGATAPLSNFPQIPGSSPIP